MDSIATLKNRWLYDDKLEIGREIYLKIPDKARLLMDITNLLISKYSGTDDVRQLLFNTRELLLDYNRWKDGHLLFDNVREKVLTEERSGDKDKNKVSLLLIIELILKITYNLSNPTDPFDEDSGWWLIYNLRDKDGSLSKFITTDHSWAVIEPHLIDMNA